EAKTQLRAASIDVSRYELITRSGRLSPLIFGYREEVGRLSIDPNTSYDSAVSDLTSLMRAVKAVALERGAKQNGITPVVSLAEHIDPDTKQS
ncbi:hypothetical protein ABTN09_20095, partial [Acinetobacter baumannii]